MAINRTRDAQGPTYLVRLIVFAGSVLLGAGLATRTAEAQSDTPISASAGAGTLFYGGPSNMTLCCPTQSFSCGGSPGSSNSCECMNPDSCWPAQAGQCGGSVSGAEACTPGADQCPPPDEGTEEDLSTGGGCTPEKTPFAGDGSCDETTSGSANDADKSKHEFDIHGADPILAGARTAASTPFTDFKVGRLSSLSLTRTYSSADADRDTGGAGGIFGRRWRHDWEAYLTCDLGICSIKRGALASLSFAYAGTAESPDGSETWAIYRSYAKHRAPRHHHVLARRPTGEWMAFLSDGRTLRFGQVCTSCDGASSAYCTDASSGGRARLVGVIDRGGNTIHVDYDPANRILLKLADDLGHTLDVRSGLACGTTARELRYDGVLAVSYTMQGNLLKTATDPDGRVLRAYSYWSTGAAASKLQAVIDESGTAIAEFAYDGEGRVIGLVDAESSLAMTYGADCDASWSGLGGPFVGQGWAAVVCWARATATEHYKGAFGDSTATTIRGVRSVTGLIGFLGRVEYGVANVGDSYDTVAWTDDGRPDMSTDADGHNVRRSFDGLGREIHRMEFHSDEQVRQIAFDWSMTPWLEFPLAPSPLPADARQEWRAYGVTRTVARGVVLDLDRVTQLTRPSDLQPGAYAQETFDYDQSPTAYDPAGYSCTMSPLPQGSVLCRTMEVGQVTVGGTIVSERHATFFSHDSRGRLVRTYGPVNLDRPGPNDVVPVEERAYYGDGDTPERQGRLQEVRRYASPTAPALVTTFDYDRLGVSKVVSPAGISATLTKDGRGRPTVITYADATGVVQARTETRYQDGLTPRLRVLPSGAAERYGYDLKGRLARVEQLSGDPEATGANPKLAWSEHHAYDPSGNRYHSERLNPSGVVTWRQDRGFDQRHRVVWESNPSQPSLGKSWTYSSSGFLKSFIDEESRLTAFGPDGLDRVGSVARHGRDLDGQVVDLTIASYERVPGGEAIAAVSDGAGRPVNYRYDDFGRVEQVSGPTLARGGGAWYRYDARGNVVARGDSSVNVAYQYDGLDRVSGLQASNSADGSSVSYTYVYDAPPFIGRLTSVVGPEGTTHFTYDWAGRLEAEIRYTAGVSLPFTTLHAYDANGRLWRLAYPSGLTVEYVRDAASGEVTEVRQAGGAATYARDVTHAGGGAWATLTFGNGHTLQQAFTLRGEPLAVRSGPVDLEYLPSPAGNVGVMTDRSQEPSGCGRRVARSFGYDLNDRLVEWSDEVQSEAGVCAPDGLGSGPVSFSYVDGTDQVASQQGASGTRTHAYGYDGQGNVSAIGRYDAAGTSLEERVCLRHDALGRLVQVGTTSSAFTPGGAACLSDAEVSGALARFKYDWRNLRVASQRAGQWTYTVFDTAGHPLSEFLQTGSAEAPWSKLRDYLWLDGQLLAQVEYEGSGGAGVVYYAHLDHLGQPRALTSGAGQVVWASYQRPYGEVLEKTVPDAQTGRTVVTNLRLPGQYDERLLGSVGLQGPYYNWNRWYLPSVGRYLELDPIAKAGGFNGFYGPNWYGYAEGNPLRWTDPRGLDIYTWTHENMPWIEGEGWGAGQKCMAECMEATNPLGGAGTSSVLALGPLPKWPAWWQPGASHFTSIWRYANIGSRSVCGEPLISGPTTKMLGKGGVYVTLASGVVSYGVIAACAIHCAGGQ